VIGTEASVARSPRVLLVGAAAALALAVGTVAWASGDGPRGWLYLALYTLATLPGWPVGFWLFGRRHAAGWVSGALLGYGLTGLALWAPMVTGIASPAVLAGGWALLCAVTWTICGRRAPLVDLPAWTRRDTAALLLILVVVPALVGVPFARIGERGEDGTRHYRAYFTADFLWHMALTSELTRLELPPTDPYAAGHQLHYYWTYFLFPASVAAGLPAAAPSVEGILRVNALGAGLLFVGIVFVFAWSVAPRAWPAAAATLLAVLSASAEGSYVLWRLWKTGGPLASLRDLNIDAITMWFFQGLTVDGLPRSLWYTPQHAGACALGLIALIVLTRTGSKGSLAARLLSGLALALSVTVSPFLGGAFALVYGAAVFLDALLERRRFISTVVGHAWTAAPVALAVAWAVLGDVLEGARGAVVLGFVGRARKAPVATMLLALGPLLVPALLGIVVRTPDRRRKLPPLAGSCVGLALFYLVSLAKTDPVWVGWRAGQIMLVSLPALAALWIASWWDRSRGRPAAAALLFCAFAAGLPTTAIDTFNAQDIDNRNMGAGFPWTVRVGPDEQLAFEWIRRATPRDAVVQPDPIARGRASWTHIPSFARRRMAAGLPISLVAMPYREEASNQVRSLYSTEDAMEAWTIARRLGIDYLYVDHVEREAHPPAALAKFDDHPELFVPAYRNPSVTIYAVAVR
jgi:hypothetical protein